ncbi:lipid-A-disaccharide synthase [Sulfurospirillum arcachonense]|uniref:lipid-A-disaccharide synthase n=1 Tax=Sulfurospirillum arcachonense TaxID=57666 RepID=UPI00046A24C6|nr:lipid-A-disaccharide synthase [Sulfurospirillum arcachonense]
MSPVKLLVSALEPSANLHMEPIIKAIGNCELLGIFDEKFGKPLLPSRAFSIMGFVDAIPKIRLAKKTIEKMAQLSLLVDTVILIDSPAFNLPLAKAIKKINPNVKIIYYILPQVWAWKEKRVAKVEKYCDVLASILPFEQQFYNRAKYVGHPLLDEIATCKEKYEATGYIAYLPGSRKSEIKKLMPIYKEVAKKINKNNILVIPPHFNSQEIKEIYGDIREFDISRDTYKTFLKSEFAFVCSGTATLEASLIGVPLVLAYKAKAFDAFIARMFVKLKHVGLANIIFDFEGYDPLHVELLQEKVTVENLMDEYVHMDRKLFYENSLKLHRILKHGSANEMIKLIKI